MALKWVFHVWFFALHEMIFPLNCIELSGYCGVWILKNGNLKQSLDLNDSSGMIYMDLALLHLWFSKELVFQAIVVEDDHGFIIRNISPLE